MTACATEPCLEFQFQAGQAVRQAGRVAVTVIVMAAVISENFLGNLSRR